MRGILKGQVLVGWGLMSIATGPPDTARAQTSEVILSRSYVRATGTPVTATDTFPACDLSGRFTLVIDNGPSGQPKVTSGTVSVNGLEVVHDSDFKQKVPHLERSLSGIQAANRLDVRLVSQPGGTIAISVVAVQSCLRITSPTAGASIDGPIVLVAGEVKTRPGSQLGVTVNGVPALVDGTHFAGFAPVDSSVQSLTAEAHDFTGARARDTIGVTVTGSVQGTPVMLRSSPSGGMAPLTVGFGLSSLVAVSQVALDADGDGTADIQGATLEGQTFTYPRPGVYTPTARVTDAQGQVHTAVTLVQVLDPVALDAQLQAVWSGFKAAVRAGDLARAAQFLHSDTRDAYQAQLALLNSSTLATIDQIITTIDLVEVGFGGAEYEMLRVRDGQTLSFAVWFQLDQDGLWRLRRF
jgi:hypothetical protein